MVTTFEARFQSALNLVRELRNSGVTVPIFVVINGNFPRGGHVSKARDDFLRQLVQFPSINPICLGSGRGLAYVLNSALKLTHAERIAVLADDCEFEPSTTQSAVQDLFSDLETTDLVVLNNDMGNFGVTRHCLISVGWFNEFMTGIGWEDADFIWRTRLDTSLRVSFRSDNRLRNSGSDLGFESIVAEKPGSKYSLVNRVVMREIFWNFNRSAKGLGGPALANGDLPESSRPKRRRKMAPNPLPLEGLAEMLWSLNNEVDPTTIQRASGYALRRLGRKSSWR